MPLTPLSRQRPYHTKGLAAVMQVQALETMLGEHQRSEEWAHRSSWFISSGVLPARRAAQALMIMVRTRDATSACTICTARGIDTPASQAQRR